VILLVAVWWLFAAVTGAPLWRPLAPAYSDTAPESFPRDPRLEGLGPVEELGWPEQHDLAPPQDYGWEDREARVMRIPVDVAIEVMLERANRQADEPGSAGREN